MSGGRHLAVYRALSGLYPRSFREAYGEDLVLLFAHQVSDDGALRTWLRTVRDLAVTVPTTHLEAIVHDRSHTALTTISSAVAAGATVTALLVGTGSAATFVLLAVGAACAGVAVAAWRADRPVHEATSAASSWWKVLGGGVLVLLATLVGAAIPWPAAIDLGDDAYWLVVASVATGLALVGVGLLLGASALLRHRRGRPPLRSAT